jgi:hypothetical protein
VGGASSLGVLEGFGAQTSLQWSYDTGGGSVPVLGRSFPTPQDWRGAGAIAFTIVGQASGRTVDIRVVTASASGGLDRWDATFVDDQLGARTVVISWDNLAHVSSRGDFDLQGPMPLARVAAVAMGVTGRGRGSLVIQSVVLEPGDSRLIFSPWPEKTRRSLPPWR